MGKLLEVNNLSISFTQYVQGLNRRDLKVISDLSLDIDESEIVAVLGSSGSGKSLLAHSILGILPYNAHVTGEIKYKGQTLNQEIKERIRGKEICLIPQSVNFLDPLMKVSEQAVGECKDKAERVEKKIKQREVFSKYGLDESVDDLYPFELSGGMARKVLLSTALLNDPDLLIADEPTTALDVTIQAQILELMQELQKKMGMAIIMVTHDLGVIASMCDEILVMYGGRVCERGTADAIFYSPAHEYTKGLLRSIPTTENMNERLVPIGGTPINLLNMPQGCAFCPRCENAMKICLTEKPEEYWVGEDHLASCWMNVKDCFENHEEGQA